ncbi:hypothetical protein [Streptomyces sp. 4N124]|uniref:hypothetical protein n=1 Tax=Streptomyces sp. 4N124 TaxID=3457420 RepID=UPI003FD0C6A8
MKFARGTAVDLASLPALEPLNEGEGGEGTVYRLLGTRLVFKRYHDDVRIIPAAMQRLIDWPASLKVRDRRLLDARAAWPRNQVLDGHRTVGVLLPLAPAHAYFLRSTDGKRALRELQHLVHAERAVHAGVAPICLQYRIKLMQDLIELLLLFEQHEIVHGDINGRNVVWSKPAWRRGGVYLLDCDGCQLGDTPVMSVRRSAPQWRDPDRPQSGPDLDSDRYGLALVMARALAQTEVFIGGGRTHLSSILQPPFDHPTFKGALAHGLGSRPNRLRASIWKDVLGTLPSR